MYVLTSMSSVDDTTLNGCVADPYSTTTIEDGKSGGR